MSGYRGGVGGHSVAVAELHGRGQEAHPRVGLDLTTFERDVLERATALSERQGLGGADDVIAMLHGADLYLAIACARGLPGSWEQFDACHSARLLAFLRARGAEHEEARDLVTELPGTLLLPRADGRRPIDTYDGSVQLSTWLGMIVLRRLTDLWRSSRRATQPLDADLAETRPDSVGDADEGGRIARALRNAWKALGDRDRLVLLWKFRDELSQRRIGELLGLGEPRVSRLVSGALERLREALRGAGVREAPDVPEVRAAVAQHLANPERKPEQEDEGGDGR